ncbi:MAG: glutathione binding-like protein [Candidatus Binataceae bacterium]
MAEYIEVERARAMTGLRLVLTPGVPGPWSEAAKSILHVKKLPFVKVHQELGGANRELLEWTAQASAPVMVWNEERPRSLWNDQLCLAERLQLNPPLVPANLEDRVLMFGYANEICGENGFGWAKRLLIIRQGLENPDEAGRHLFTYLANKYGYDKVATEAAPARIAEILNALSARLELQRKRGSRFFIGDALTAVDIYWATFAAMNNPLPDELCPMSPGFRSVYTNTDPTIKRATVPVLLEHRDFIYHNYLELPLDF